MTGRFNLEPFASAGYRRYFLSATLAAVAIWVYQPAVEWIVLTRTGLAGAVGLLDAWAGGERSFAELRRSYEKVTGAKISASSFYNRFTPAFTQFLRELLSVGLEKLTHCAEGAAAGMNWLWRGLIAAGLIGGGAAARHLAGK